MAVRPPKLSRQQFLLQRPKGVYQNYLQAYNRQHPPPGQQVEQRPLPTISSLLSRVGQFETPAQIEARANRMANQGVKAQQAIITQEAAQLRNEAQQRMLAMAAAGRAAAQMNAGLFGMVGGEYSNAANEIRGLGSNLAGSIQQTTAGDQLAQDAGLAQVGAPGLTVGGPSGLGGATQAGVESYRGGELPGQQIANAGGAAQFGLAGMVSAQNLRATQEAQAAYMQSVHDADASRTAALKELAAGRPAQAAQFLQQLQDAQRQQMGLASGLIQQRAAMRQAGFEQKTTKTKLAADLQNQKFQQGVTLQELAMKQQGMAVDLGQVDAPRSYALGYVVDKSGRPILRNGKRIPIADFLKSLQGSYKASSTGASRSLTPGQQVDLLGKAQSLAESLFFGYGTDAKGKRVPVTQLGTFDPEKPATWSKNGQADYSSAVRRLTSMGLDRASAESILTSYYERGDRGRPAFSPAEEKILRKRMGPNKLKWVKGQYTDLVARGQIAAAQSLMNEVLGNYGKNLAWVGKK